MADIRSKLLNTKSNRSRLVTVKVSDEETLTVKVKVPSVAERNDIQSKVRAPEGGAASGAGISEGQALAVIFCALNPDTGAPIFGIEDLDSLKSLDANSWVDEIFSAAMGLMAEAQEAAKK